MPRGGPHERLGGGEVFVYAPREVVGQAQSRIAVFHNAAPHTKFSSLKNPHVALLQLQCHHPRPWLRRVLVRVQGQTHHMEPHCLHDERRWGRRRDVDPSRRG